jgi:hypothetical protein
MIVRNSMAIALICFASATFAKSPPPHANAKRPSFAGEQGPPPHAQGQGKGGSHDDDYDYDRDDKAKRHKSKDRDWSDSERGDKKHRDFDRTRDRKAAADRRGSYRVRNREGGADRMSEKGRARSSRGEVNRQPDGLTSPVGPASTPV